MVLTISRYVFRKLLNVLFTNQPYSIKKISKFDRELLLYIDQHIGRKIYLGIYERDETLYFLNEIRNDEICLDVGANIGYFTFLFASVAHSVIAVEPIRANADLIRLTSSINRDTNVRIICAAVSNSVDEMEFVEADETSLSGISSNETEDDLKMSYSAIAAGHYKVSTITIDSLKLDKLDIVKMDIEGFEYVALKGMSLTLESLKPRLLMIELVEDHLGRFDTSIQDVINFLGNYGYIPRVLSEGKLVNYDGQRISNDNLFFTLTK